MAFLSTWLLLLLQPLLLRQVPDSTGMSAQLAQLDSLVQDSSKPVIARQALDLARNIDQNHPKQYEAKWRLARAGFLLAYHSQQKKTKVAAGFAGYQAGLAAIELNPKRVEAHYWGACALGEYGRASGVLEAITKGYGAKVQKMLEKAVALDPHYDQGAPLESLGRFWYMLPWPMGDLKKSRTFLQRAVKIAPQRVRRNAFLADTYHKLGEAVLAKKHYQSCASSKVQPGFDLDAHSWQKHCREKLNQLRRE